MANTTNYNWETPDDTDLVKDGAAAIRTLGSSIDTTTKNLNPETTTGDIAYRSATANTNTRLPIGTNGQILAVSAGVPAWINNDQGDITEVQAGTGISVASGTGPIPVVTNTVATTFDAAGDLVYGTGADTFTKLSLGTAGKVLKVNSGATAPEWAVDPTTDVVTTAGDLIYATGADAVTRLGIGTAGQVLKVNSGATAPEWGAAAGASGLTLISRSSFSNVAGQNFDDVFSATYNAYKIIIEVIYAATDSDTLRLQVRTSGGTQTSGYYGSTAMVSTAATTFGSSATSSNAASLQLNNGNLGNNTSGASYGASFDWVRVGSTNYNKLFGVGFNTENSNTLWFAGFRFANENVTGFRLFGSTSNVTGTVAIYGYGA